MTYRVLATARSFCNTPGPHLDFLESHGCEVVRAARSHPLSSPDLALLIPGFDGVILGLDACDARVLEAADRLRAISRYGVGVSEVDIEGASERGIAVTNTPGANALGVAELAVALMFSVARAIPRTVESARRNEWVRHTGWELTGKTLGLIGLGTIGREVAKRARGLGMRVIGFDPVIRDVDGVESVPFDALLAESHVVSLHAALTDATRHLIDVDRIGQMRDGAVLINTARGGLVDQGALEEALIAGKLAGAASDTLEDDPPEDHPLLQLDNFLYTPHIGASTTESVERAGMMAAQNLVAVLRGEPCEFVVNREALERHGHALGARS